MSIKHWMAAGMAVAVLTACGSDINITPTTIDNSVDNSTSGGDGGSTTNPCASYTRGGGLVQGTFDGIDCTYSRAFADRGNNLTVDLFVPDLPGDGAHIFEGSLFVGETCDTDQCLADKNLTRGGDGPTLTIEAGATLAWTTNEKFLIINRGSQIRALGTASAPITFTSKSDVDGTVGPEDVQQWGGIVINGFGITNKCAYTGDRAAGTLATSDCHVDAEGALDEDESQYGGDVEDDSSGTLQYVVVKHTGATVANGDELNGISFGGVGSGTRVENLQVYSTFDDGIEMFGGSFDINNFVGVYVRDDAIDIDEGYNGTITNALVIQSATDGNHCIEADGLGSFDSLTAVEVEAKIAQGLNSAPTINNLTCVISANGADTATHDPGAGWRLREGIFAVINDSLVVGSFAANSTASANDNYCLRIDNRSQDAALAGDLEINSTIFACAEKTRGQSLAGGTETEESWATSRGNIFATIPDGTAVNATASADTDLQLLEGTPPFYSIEYATMFVDGAAPAGAPQAGTFIGGVALSIPDWTDGWTYGLKDGARAQPLWFE